MKIELYPGRSVGTFYRSHQAKVFNRAHLFLLNVAKITSPLSAEPHVVEVHERLTPECRVLRLIDSAGALVAFAFAVDRETRQSDRFLLVRRQDVNGGEVELVLRTDHYIVWQVPNNSTLFVPAGYSNRLNEFVSNSF